MKFLGDTGCSRKPVSSSSLMWLLLGLGCWGVSHVSLQSGSNNTTVPLSQDSHSAGGSQCRGNGSEAMAAGAELLLEVAIEHCLQPRDTQAVTPHHFQAAQPRRRCLWVHGSRA